MGIAQEGFDSGNPKNADGESYLGFRSRRRTLTLLSGAKAVVNESDVEFFVSCIALDDELAPGVKLKQVFTPFLNEDHRDSPAWAPAGVGSVTCAHGASILSPRTSAKASESGMLRRSGESASSRQSSWFGGS